MNGPMRFNELQRDLGSVTPGTLTKQLKGLEDSGIVNRQEFDEIPPRVEYSLTEVGQALRPLVHEFAAWAKLYAAATAEKPAQ